MAEINFLEFGRKFGMFYLPFLFSLCFHEYAHGQVAKWKGDNTADVMGRLTMNPMAHIDWIGTVMLPFMALLTPIPLFFGWAKPVPVNTRNLKNPIKDMFWIAFAGPLSNILLAIVGTLGFALVVGFFNGTHSYKALQELCFVFVSLNLILAFFNMIPLHPLDGGKVLARFLPREWNQQLEALEPYSIWIILGIFLVGGGSILFAPVVKLTEILMGAGFLLGRIL